MTRMSISCMAASTLTALALSATGAAAELIHVPTTTPKITVHTPTITGQRPATGGSAQGSWSMGIGNVRADKGSPVLFDKHKDW